ncbi:hypothetical protein [Limosilactobacillus kribbianus]|uniref:hypothetical protein n=1 Tax=Limosilactobacillus kribbianus TaxID=2982695 RepID=UPI00226456C9|nr:hypothetical protein [Limosilactobacillus kribbianus]
MTYEEAIQVENTGELVSMDGHEYRVFYHKELANSGHYVFFVQQQTLGVPRKKVEIDEQTLACMRRKTK